MKTKRGERKLTSFSLVGNGLVSRTTWFTNCTRTWFTNFKLFLDLEPEVKIVTNEIGLPLTLQIYNANVDNRRNKSCF